MGTIGKQSSINTDCFLCVSFPQVFTKYGKCYVFNSGEEGHPLLTTFKGGTGNGLEIMLDIQQDEYLPIWGETGKEEVVLFISPAPNSLSILLNLQSCSEVLMPCVRVFWIKKLNQNSKKQRHALFYFFECINSIMNTRALLDQTQSPEFFAQQWLVLCLLAWYCPALSFVMGSKPDLIPLGCVHGWDLVLTGLVDFVPGLYCFR